VSLGISDGGAPGIPNRRGVSQGHDEKVQERPERPLLLGLRSDGQSSVREQTNVERALPRRARARSIWQCGRGELAECDGEMGVPYCRVLSPGPLGSSVAGDDVGNCQSQTDPWPPVSPARSLRVVLQTPGTAAVACYMYAILCSSP
jgi:hypothetical protein